ncbi:MAG TPA: hypothetical protein DCG75_08425 [Bacteroidales bacterium]|jgi:hypothetical protein|nr:hypothetical protein [Bacteroidales bacterium]
MDLLKYIFSLSLVLISVSFCFGQEENLYAPKEEKVPLVLKGIKLGVNVGRFTDFQFKPERFSYEASLDFNLSNKYYGIIEAGYSEIDLKKENYNYSSEGNFYKIGMDYNMLKKQPSDYLGMGFRIGRADFTQSANNILIEDDHWPSFTTAIDSKSYNMYWLEVSFGLKGELFKNVYLGWAAMVKIRMTGGKDAAFQAYDIPGFGKGESSINLGANYYIYYQIPFNRNK